MHNKQKYNIALVAVLIVAFAAGIYLLLRPPAPKPLSPPEPQAPSQPAPEPIAGAPQFDVSKYVKEPVVSIYVADKGTVLSMPLEKYLEGVVAKEMEPDWPIEALAAQAIASRTLTISAIEAGTIRKIRGTDVSTVKEELQAYAPEKINHNVREAVKRTRGQILMYNGNLVNAIYSSCCGQITASKEESFPTEIKTATPYFQPVTDNCLEYAPEEQRSWAVTVPASEVAEAVGYKGNPADISILERGPSGRILYIGAGEQKVFGSDFRKAIGYDRLKSTLVSEMTYEGGNFVFKGTGWGNGVGLCQWGAYTFARQGMTAPDILKHYYTHVEIKKLWD